MGKDSLEKRLRQIENLAKTGDKRPLTVYSEEPGRYYTLEGEARVPISRKELERLGESAILTLVVLDGCLEEDRPSGLFVVSAPSREGMMMIGRILAGERTERATGMEDESNENQS